MRPPEPTSARWYWQRALVVNFFSLVYAIELINNFT